MMAALDTSFNKDLVEMAVPWYGGWGYYWGAIPSILLEFFNEAKFY